MTSMEQIFNNLIQFSRDVYVSFEIISTLISDDLVLFDNFKDAFIFDKVDKVFFEQKHNSLMEIFFTNCIKRQSSK